MWLRYECPSRSGVDVVRWRAGKITVAEASIVIALLMYNTVLIDRAIIDPMIGQPSDLLASSSLQSQLGNIVGLDLPISFDSVNGVVRYQSPCSSADVHVP